MNITGLIRQFWRHQYEANELLDLDGAAIARLFGEQIHSDEAEGVVEVSVTFFYRDPLILGQQLTAWLADRGYRLIPANQRGEAVARAEVILQARERPGEGQAIARYRITEAEQCQITHPKPTKLCKTVS